MSKFRVTSGEFEVIVHEFSLKKAGDLAIKLHNDSNHPSELGELTLVEKINSSNKPVSHLFLLTQNLINSNTNGMGDNCGQYQRID